MKKVLMFIFLVAGCGGIAHAGSPTGVYASSITLNLINVSTTTATRVDTPLLKNRAYLEIHNADPTAIIWCAPTQAGAGIATARSVNPHTSWVINLADIGPNDHGGFFGTAYNLNIWCLSDSSSFGTTRASVIQAY